MHLLWRFVASLAIVCVILAQEQNETKTKKKPPVGNSFFGDFVGLFTGHSCPLDPLMTFDRCVVKDCKVVMNGETVRDLSQSEIQEIQKYLADVADFRKGIRQQAADSIRTGMGEDPMHGELNPTMPEVPYICHE